MVELSPIRAWHPALTGPPADSLVCPVYDTLSEADFAQYASQPHNAARFVPRPSGMPLATFLERATHELRSAQDARAFVQDDLPSLYVYGIRYVPPDDIVEALAPENRRSDYLLLGLVGALDLAGLEHGQVALHERTFPDRVAERVALTEATGMSFAPILAGYHASGHPLNDRIEAILGLRRSALEFRSTVPPIAEATVAGTRHLLWRIDEAEPLASLAHEARALRLLILDGHHRFTAAAQRQHDGHRSAPLVMLVDGSDRALQLLPWHRVLVPKVATPAVLLDRARREFETVSPATDVLDPASAGEHLRRMHRDGVRGFLLASELGIHEVRGTPSEDAGADFDQLHEFLDDTLGIDPRSLAFVRSPRAALDAVASSDGGTAFLLPALSARGVEARAFERGEVMAQKSTMFLPKVAEGMLFARADGTP